MSFTRAEQERLFLERCFRLYERVEKIRARVDCSTPECMFGSYLGRQNEMRKSLNSAKSPAENRSLSNTPINVPDDATIEEKIQHFLLTSDYKKQPRRRFAYLRKQANKQTLETQLPTDVMDVHAAEFTDKYPRILRKQPVESKLRQMPLFYQKVSISSSDHSVESSNSSSTSTASSSSSSNSVVDDNEITKTSSERTTSSLDVEAKRQSKTSTSHLTPNSSTNTQSKHSRSTASTISSGHPNELKSPRETSKNQQSSTDKSTVTSARAKSASLSSMRTLPPRPSKQQNSFKQSPIVDHPLDQKIQASPESDADTTNDVSPMGSTESLNDAIFDPYVDFLNEVTDVILGMGAYSQPAIQAAVDAVIASNCHPDIDRTKAQFLVNQLFT